MAKLVINPTSAAKKEIPIVARVISIGRDPSNDLVLSDSMVSRRHAILEHRDNQYILRDNNSSNGTMVNGDRVDDGVVGAALAASLRVPLVLARHRALPPASQAVLDRYNGRWEQILVIGGFAAVADEVVAAAEAASEPVMND